MGTRSDVFVAIKNELWDSLKDLSIWECAGTQAVSPEGHRGFLFQDIKWYRDEDDELVELYNRLQASDIDGENHWIVEACHDYPESDDGDSGNWSDNPWRARRQVSVSIVSSIDSSAEEDDDPYTED